MKKAKLNINIRKGNLVSLLLATFSFLFLFIDQMYLKQGGGKLYFGIFQDDIGDLSGVLTAAKVFAIITLVVYAIKFVASFINFDKLVSNFKFGVNRLISLAYYGFYALTLLFIFIGSIAASSEECETYFGQEVCVSSSCVPRFAVYFMFVFVVLAILGIVLPKFKNKVSETVALNVID